MEWYPLKRAITRYNVGLVKTHDKIGCDTASIPYDMLAYSCGGHKKILIQDRERQREFELAILDGFAVHVAPVYVMLHKSCTWHQLINEFQLHEAAVRLGLGIEKSWWRRRFFKSGKITMYHSGWTLYDTDTNFYYLRANIAGVRTLAPF